MTSVLILSTFFKIVFPASCREAGDTCHCLWSLEPPLLCNFLNTGAERWYLLHIFSSILLKKEDTMRWDQHILTFLLCFYALLGKIPCWHDSLSLPHFSLRFPLKPIVFPAVGEFTNQMGVLPFGPQNVWRLMIAGQISLPAQKRHNNI